SRPEALPIWRSRDWIFTKYLFRRGVLKYSSGHEHHVILVLAHHQPGGNEAEGVSTGQGRWGAGPASLPLVCGPGGQRSRPTRIVGDLDREAFLLEVPLLLSDKER